MRKAQYDVAREADRTSQWIRSTYFPENIATQKLYIKRSIVDHIWADGVCVLLNIVPNLGWVGGDVWW